ASAGARAEAATSATARRSGKSVEVTALGTPDTKVVAHPDGTVTATMYNRPVRVRKGSGWVPVDTTLVVRPDGSVAPKAAAVPVVFSGGGTKAAPLARARPRGAEFGLDWTGRLPRPVLDGDTAVYRSLLPGVDLRLTATGTGFAPSLIVRTEAAARDPRLRALRFGLHRKGAATLTGALGPAAPAAQSEAGEGRTARPGTPEGRPGSTAKAGKGPRTGSTAKSGTGPRDGSAPKAGKRPAAWQGATGPRALDATPVRWRVSRDAVTVGAGAALAAPGSTYPMTVNGPVWGNKLHWMVLSHNTLTGAKAAFWDSAFIGRAGRARGEELRWRSYYEMNTAALAGKRVISAQFSIHQWWADSCTPQPVELWHIDRISPATTWDTTRFHRKVGQSSLGWGHDATCEAQPIGFDVKDLMREAADNRWPTTSLALKADEGPDSYAPKEFLDKRTPGLQDPILAITGTYNTVPDRATGLAVGAKGCGTGDLVIKTTTPKLSATVTDPDTPGNGAHPAAVFRWWEGAGAPTGQVFSSRHTGMAGTRASLEPDPSQALRDGATYTFGVTADDGIDSSDGTPWCTFTVDATKPTTTPAITSTDFPPSPAIGPPLYTQGRFTLDARGDHDVTGFAYGFGSSTKPELKDEIVAADAPGGKAVISHITDRVTKFSSLNYLRVVAVDRAGNHAEDTAAAVYAFRTPDVITAGTVYAHWSADSTADGRLRDGPPGAAKQPSFHAPITGNITEIPDRIGNRGAIRLDGTASHAATASAVVRPTGRNTFGSFTVMAWVKLDRTNDWATAVSQDGPTHSGFALKYSPYPRSWEFSMPRAEAAGSEGTAAVRSVSFAQAGLWTHLAGVYDDTAGRMRLFVNGRQADETSHTSTWYASGPTAVGRAKYNGLLDDFWPGDLDEAQIYPWAASPFEVRHRMKDTASYGPNAQWPLDEGSGRTAADSTPNGGHTLALHDGTSWAAPGRPGSGAALRLDGREGHAYTSGPVAARTGENTFGSFTVTAWVKLHSRAAYVSAVSQDGRYDNGFNLGYSSYPSAWTFGMSATDAETTGGGDGYLLSDVMPQTGVWTHLAGVYDHTAGTISLYVNGRPAGSKAHRSTWYAEGATTIGRSKHDGWLTNYWPGEIDDVALSDGARTAAEIKQAMGGPSFAPGGRWALDDSPADETGHGHTLSLWNGATWTTGKDGQGGALRLDGLDGHAHTAGPVIRPDKAFTVAAWVKPDALDRYQTVVSQDGPLTSGFRLFYAHDALNNVRSWSFGIAGDTGSGGTVPDGLVTATTAPRAGVWIHLAGVYRPPGPGQSQGEMQLFVDGRLQASAPYTSVATAEQVLAIGRGKNGGFYVDRLAGTVDRVEVRDSAALPEEIRAMGDIAIPSFEMNNPAAIPDLGTVESQLATTGLTPDMAGHLKVDVDIAHPYRGDLTLYLVAPDGTEYALDDLRGTGDVDGFKKSYSLNASGESVNGTWKLRIKDGVIGDTGTLTGWRISAPITNTPAPAAPWPAQPGPAFQAGSNTVTERALTVAGTPGKAPSNLQLDLATSGGDGYSLRVSLIAPPRPGRTKEEVHVLYDSEKPPPAVTDACGRGQPNPYTLRKRYIVDASASPANGAWKLRFEHSSGSGAPRVDAWRLSSPIGLTASTTAPETKFANPADVPLTYTHTYSDATACGIPGAEAKDLRVAVDIRHPNRGDLKLELEAPGDAKTYLLEDIPDYDTGEDVRKTYTIPGAAQLPNGTWALKVTDTKLAWAGHVNEWSVQLLPSAEATFKPGWNGQNTTDVPITDDGWSESPITVEVDKGTMAPKVWQVSVALRHTYRGDLALYLEAPDGTGYLLEDLTGGGDADDFTKSYTVNASSEIAQGVWKLRVLDAVWGDTGLIDSWSLTPAPFAPALTTTRTPVPDLATAESPLTVADGTGNAPNGLQIQPAITHARPDQLVITLLGPDGTAYPLHDRKPVLPPVFTIDASSKALKGTWKLRVQDTVAGEAGSIDSWGLVLTPRVAWPEQRGPAFTVEGASSGTEVSSWRTVSGIAGNAPADLRLRVDTSYSWASELEIALVAPDGTRYVVHDRGEVLARVWTVNVSGETANGAWRLSVKRHSTCCAVRIDGWRMWSPVNQQATAPAPVTKFANGTDLAIPDDGFGNESPVTVSGIPGNARADLRVTVDIRHPRRGDLVIGLQAPDGSLYPLEDFPDSDTGADVFKQYVVNASAEPANGTWYLTVRDIRTGATGTVDGWSLGPA
ncbi:proprotein convertase P-domain-containing protein, partial [Streptomyces sp. NPDC055078]